MNKSDLITKIVNLNSGVYQKDATKIVNIFFNTISNAMSKNDRVELRGFGAFSVQHRRERTGRNPRTGEAVQVDEKFIPRFKTGKELRLKLNSKNNSSISQEEEN